MEISLSRLQTFYGHLEIDELLTALIENEFKDDEICLFSSFGAYSALLIALVLEVNPKIPVLFLDTEKHFKETIDYVNEIEKRLKIKNLVRIHPKKELKNNIDPKGELWQFNVNRCCWLRKVEPLKSYLDDNNFKAVITGRRKYQTKERSEMEKIELDENNRFRINPILDWDKKKIAHEFEKRNLPQHPLFSKGYPSIGCEPCTKAVHPGEDERSGRWANAIDMTGKQKQECGIHLDSKQVVDWNV
ncbi:MAG: phosphoadenylyl-sulfate reductase [Alphaproteobacteria bacterium]|jgi:phosphoadenosine phosphosulfate reductase